VKKNKKAKFWSEDQKVKAKAKFQKYKRLKSYPERKESNHFQNKSRKMNTLNPLGKTFKILYLE